MTERRTVLEPWMVIEAVAHRQKSKTYHSCGPTPRMIYKDICDRYGFRFNYAQVKDMIFDLDGSALYYDHNGGNGYPMYFHFYIHPDYFPEYPFDDPYTPAERDKLRLMLDRAEEDRQIAKAQAEDRRRKKEAEERDQRRRQKMRRDARPDHVDDVERKWIDVVEAKQIIEICPSRVVVLDTETTGLNPYDNDILELTLMNGAGCVIMCERYNSWSREWPEAQAVNHISPEDVKDLYQFEDSTPAVTGFLEDKLLIIGYNLPFDLCFLEDCGVKFPANCMYCDVMDDFAEFYGEWAEWAGDYGEGGWKWQKLTTAARYYGISTVGAHGSLKDCDMTLKVLLRLADEPEKERHREGPR